MKKKLFKLSILLLAFYSCERNEEEIINNKSLEVYDKDLNKTSKTQQDKGVLYDNLPFKNSNSLSDFVVQGNKWNKNSLTYYYKNGTNDIIGNIEKEAIRQAFNMWSEVTPLIFTETSNPDADIIIAFEEGNHGDGNPFDNVGGVLAHAFFPPPNSGSLAGDMHFDDSETWTVSLRSSSSNPTDIITVAAHEIGHSLGLRHSDVPGALMYPYYNGSHRFLEGDDIEGIQSIYGHPNILNLERWANKQGGFGNEQQWFSGDFNGDGKWDVGKVFDDQGQGSLDVHLSNGNNFSIQRWSTKQGGFGNEQQWFTGDFNGDGKWDIGKVFDDQGQGSIDVHLSNGNNFSIQRWATKQGGFGYEQQWFTGDFNGDGKWDVGKVFDDQGQCSIDVHLSNGNNFSIQRWATKQGGFGNEEKWFTGDFNGDGRCDLGKVFDDNGLISIDVYLSNGNNFSRQRWATKQGGFGNEQQWFSGDFNSDGKWDVGKVFDDNGLISIDVHISNGNSFSLQRWATKQGGFGYEQQWFTGDFNGDGKWDVGKVFDDQGKGSIDIHKQ